MPEYQRQDLGEIWCLHCRRKPQAHAALLLAGLSILPVLTGGPSLVA